MIDYSLLFAATTFVVIVSIVFIRIYETRGGKNNKIVCYVSDATFERLFKMSLKYGIPFAELCTACLECVKPDLLDVPAK